MQTKSMKRVLSLLLVILTICVSTNVAVASGVDLSSFNMPSGNLTVDATGTHYILADGTIAKSKWVKVFNKFMHFDSNGNLSIYNKLNGDVTMGAEGLTFVNKGYKGEILEPTSTTDGSMLAEQLAVKTLNEQPMSKKRLTAKLMDKNYVMSETGRQGAYTLEEVEFAIDKRLKVDWVAIAFKVGTLYYLENEVKPNRDSMQAGDVYEYLLGQGFTKGQADKASEKALESIYDIEESDTGAIGYGTNQAGNFIKGLLD